tara:strand:- start:1139 stop:1927 length:789 start_codon:yes stop_codon:yes gene_type:complete
MKIGKFEISTNTFIIALLVGVIILLVKCNSDSRKDLKAQIIISQNNIQVLNDSVKYLKGKNGQFIAERGVLIADKKSLKELNSELYDKVNGLEKSIPNLKPKVVIDYKTKIEHDTIYISSDLKTVNDSSYIVNFKKDTVYDENNSRSLAGEISIGLLVDSISKYNNVKVSNVKLTKDIIDMNATLVLGTKDKELKVWLESNYPGFEASKIDAVTLDPSIHPELKKLNNKKYSVGPYVGLGIGQNLSILPSFGIGIQYSIFKF